MPGIYVREASWIDWIQRKNPVLTVPSSYWLCHKNNIYKFIFRYHRMTRNVKQFYFGRELMKIIRRIIKNPPRQGQQFSTSHLLVTYNHTSWTRQDKMFALLQFKERSVAAFSHAFVLTIKVIFPTENAEHNTKYLITSSDQSLIQNDKNSIHSSKNDLLEQSDQCDNVQEEVLKSENKSIHLDNSLIVSNLRETSTNKEMEKQTTNCEDTNKFMNSSKIQSKLSVPHNVPSENITKFNNKAKVGKCLKHSTVKVKKENKNQSINSKNSTLLNSIANKVQENEMVTNQLKGTHYLEEENINKNNINKLFEVNKYDAVGNFTEFKNNSVSDVNTILEDTNAADATNIDSVNLPYQYLIEREIEDAKRKMSISKVSINETRKRKLEIHKQHSTNSVELLTDVAKTEDLSCLKKRKHVSDNMTSRSSDITDLVMEGLMFTIRQGQDTVAVIEQKTKLEVDEVLENSEKIETKKGDKCLRNSSLLGLENLITMIELPKQTEIGHKCQNTSTHELKHMQWQSSLASTSFANDNKNSNITNETQYPKMCDYKCDENMKFTESEDPEYEEEEEDIVPEALQDKIVQPSILDFEEIDKSEEKLKVIINKDLLMDDMNTEESIKFETTKTKLNSLLGKDLLPKICLKTESSDNKSFMKSRELPIKSIINDIPELQHSTRIVHKSTFDTTRKCKSNVPVVISNKIITIDQIPLPLQKILRKKSSMKHISLTTKTETDEDNTEVHKMQSCQEENTASNMQLKSQNLDCNTLKNTQYLKNFQIPVHINKETYNESTSSVASNPKLKNVNISENNLKVEDEGSRKEIVNVNKVEQLSPNKMQDITHEFYQDLLYIQKEKTLLNQKYLRSRRKSLNMLTNTNNGETRIEMMKFFHDITRGAKVVIRRMSTKSIHRIIEKSSSLATCMH